jgi:hypothetical protein
MKKSETESATYTSQRIESNSLANVKSTLFRTVRRPHGHFAHEENRAAIQRMGANGRVAGENETVSKKVGVYSTDCYIRSTKIFSNLRE